VAAPLSSNVIALVLFSSRFVAKRREIGSSGYRAGSKSVAVSSGKIRCLFPTHRQLPGCSSFELRRLRMESWLPNWQNRAMNSGGASGCGGFSGLALRQTSSNGFAPAGAFVPVQALRPGDGENVAFSEPSASKQRPGQRLSGIRRNSIQPRAITMGSTGRGVSSGPASPGWLSGRAG
jgi:hypothetical protein